MFKRVLATYFAALMALSPMAIAGGTASGVIKHPPVPEVDLGTVPETATARPPGQNNKPHPVVARLLSERAVVTPSSKVYVGVHLEQQPDWHTYWKAPGEVGLPTEIEWTLPEGVTASPHVFPIPLRFLQDDQTSFGYDGEVLHIAELTLPEDLAPGSLEIGARASWLVCKRSCIPGDGDLKLSLTVGEEAVRSEHAPLFAHFRDRWPTPAERLGGIEVDSAVAVDHVTPNAQFQVAFHVSAEPGHSLEVPGEQLWPTFTPFAGMEWMTENVRIHPLDDAFIVVIDALAFEPDPLPTGDLIGGLLQVKVDDTWVSTEVGHVIPWAAAGTATAPTDSPIWYLLPSADAEEVAQAEPDETSDEQPQPVGETDKPAGGFDLMVLLSNLALGFVGGLILNVMPCVLPVLMLKLYSLVEQGGISDGEKRTAGLAYTGGILVSFWLLGLAVLAMRSFGTEVGWGFQMQEPGYVAALATLVFLFSLSLFGVFEVPAFGVESASELGSQEGVGGYFFTGVFATLVATPCSAPILGAATAFAFSAPTAVLFMVFTAIGFGLAFPFLLVAFIPAAYKLLPQPGAWMESFKQLLGFTLVATTLWLVGVLMSLIGSDRAFWFLAFLATVSFSAWIFGHFAGVAAEGRKQALTFLVALSVSVLGGWKFLDLEMAEDVVCDEGGLADSLDFSEHIPWQAFSEARVDALAGQTVFIDFTADWCVSCKANESQILETRAVREKMDQLGVVPLKADWTRRNPTITAWLNRYDRVGVPMYLVIPPTGVAQAFTLPEVITTSMVNDALAKAAEQ